MERPKISPDQARANRLDVLEMSDSASSEFQPDSEGEDGSGYCSALPGGKLAKMDERNHDRHVGETFDTQRSPIPTVALIDQVAEEVKKRVEERDMHCPHCMSRVGPRKLVRVGTHGGRPRFRCMGCGQYHQCTEDTVFEGCEWSLGYIKIVLLLLCGWVRGFSAATAQWYASSVVGSRINMDLVRRVLRFAAQVAAAAQREFQAAIFWRPGEELQADACFRNRTFLNRWGLFHADLDRDFPGQGCIIGVIAGEAPNWRLVLAVARSENKEEILDLFEDHMPRVGAVILVTDGAKAYEALASEWNEKKPSKIVHWAVKHQTAAARRKGVKAQYVDKFGHTTNGIECQWHRLSLLPRLHPELETDIMARAWLLHNRALDYPVFLRITELVSCIKFSKEDVARFGSGLV